MGCKFVLATWIPISLSQFVLHLMWRLLRFFQKAMTTVVPGVFSRFTSAISQPIINPMSGKIVAKGNGEEPRERSREQNRKGRKGVPKGKWRIYKKGKRGGESVTRCVRETLKICVVHIHNDINMEKDLRRPQKHVSYLVRSTSGYHLWQRKPSTVLPYTKKHKTERLKIRR